MCRIEKDCDDSDAARFALLQKEHKKFGQIRTKKASAAASKRRKT